MQIYFKYVRSSAFTLVELVVVITIATIILTTLVFQQKKWDDQLRLNTSTYELALMLRQAQIYSLGVRENVASVGDKFDIGYGVHLDAQTTVRYDFFADMNKDFKYSLDESLEAKILSRVAAIYKVCAIATLTATQRCSDEALVPLEMVDISFLRPEVGARAKFLDTDGVEIPGYELPAEIYLRSRQGKISSVVIEANGQISIQ